MNEINLKVGDKLLCKKDDTCSLTRDRTISYRSKNYKGKYYNIVDIHLPWCCVGNLDYFTDKDHDYYIWDYFYTPQEMRKMKLKRLKQCSEKI